MTQNGSIKCMAIVDWSVWPVYLSVCLSIFCLYAYMCIQDNLSIVVTCLEQVIRNGMVFVSLFTKLCAQKNALFVAS